MAPRATTKQAIEFLKIYQVRRENAVLYKELQSLRGEVSELHDANDEVLKELDSVRELSNKTNAVVTQHENKFKETGGHVETLAQDAKILQSTLGNLQDRQDKQANEFSALRIHLVDEIHMLENHTKDTETGNRSTLDSLAQDLDGLRQLITQKARTATTVHQSNEESIKSVSRVYDSVVGSDDQAASFSVATSPDQFETIHTCPPAVIEDTGVVRRNLLEYQHPNHPREATVPEDLDLDDVAQNISYAGHNLERTTINDSFTMLPYQMKKAAEYIDEILALTQNPQEALSDFLKRGLDIMGKLSNASESIVIHKIVDGLTDAEHQKAWTKWLNATAWSKDNLADVACLYGLNRSDIVAERSMKMSPISAVSGSMLLPDVLVPATANSHSQPFSITREDSDPHSEVRKTCPRRSNRLAVRSQVDHTVTLNEADGITTETDSCGPPIPESTLKCIKERGAKTGTKKRKHDGRDTRGRFKKRTVGDKPLGALKSYKPNKQDTRQSLAETSGQVTGKCASRQPHFHRPPQAPPKEPSLHKSTIVQPQMTDHPSSPPVAKQNQIRGLDQCSEQVEVKSIALASPYNPKPRLISGHRRANVQLHQPTSDSEVVLPQQAYCAQNKKQANSNNGHGPQHKKRKLPLPPPPMIPILSTSTEEGSRFDTW